MELLTIGLLIGIGVATLAVLIAWIRKLRGTVATLRQELQAKDSAKRSQSTRYGQIQEQFAPFMSSWPWDPKRFKFIGDPIDGIQFTDDGVVLVEIKSASSRLSKVQREVRDHVIAGRITWQEIRIDAPA